MGDRARGRRLGLVLGVAALTLAAACSIPHIGQRPSGGGVPTGGGQGTTKASPPNGPRAVRIKGETLEWNGSAAQYEHAQDVDRTGTLWVTTTPDGRVAVALQSGTIAGSETGTLLFATNTAALAGVPGIGRSVVDAAIDVASVRTADQTGHLVAKVDPTLVRSVQVLSFQVKPGGAPKQLLDGSIELTLAGDQLSGAIDLGGADYLGGARVQNRYRATISGA